MSRPIYVTKAAPPAMAGPHDPDDDEGPKDWEIAWENAQHGHEPDSMSMEGLGGEEVIPYLSEEELHNGANKWNHINPDSPNPYRMELNKRTLDSQHGIMLPETADAQDYKNEMGHREKDGELGEWERAARADEPAPKGAEYQHHLRSAPDLDLQAEMYAQMMQNDPLNPTFTAGDPMNLAFRLLKDLSAEDLEQASRTGGLRETPERRAAYKEEGIPYGAPPMLPSGTQRNAEDMMSRQRGYMADGDMREWPYGDWRHGWEDEGQHLELKDAEDIPDEANYNFSQGDIESMTSGQSMEDPHTEPEPEWVGRTEVTPEKTERLQAMRGSKPLWQHSSLPGERHPLEDDNPAGWGDWDDWTPVMQTHKTREHRVRHGGERMPPHASDNYSSLGGHTEPDFSMLDQSPQSQALAMLHQRQQQGLPDFARQRAKQEEIERQASMERQMKQRMAEVSAAPSAAPPAREWDNSMPDPPSDAHSAAMSKLAERQAANIARQRAKKDALDSRRRRKFSRR